MEPIVSVIIPTYKFAHLISETLESVAAQTFPNWECLVVDDESPDNTREVVERFASRDSRFRYVWQKNAERCEARNHGLRLARGEFVAFLDHDDLWRPEFLQATVAFLQSRPETDLVFACGHYYDGVRCTGEVQLPEPQNPDIFEQIIRHGCPFTTSHALLRRSAVEAVGGFRTEWVLCEDFELWTRFCRRFTAAVLERPLALYRVHEGNAHQLGLQWLKKQQRLMRTLISDKTLQPVYRQAARAYLKQIYASFPRWRAVCARAYLKKFLTTPSPNAHQMGGWILAALKQSPWVVLQERWVLRALAKQILRPARRTIQ